MRGGRKLLNREAELRGISKTGKKKSRGRTKCAKKRIIVSGEAQDSDSRKEKLRS